MGSPAPQHEITNALVAIGEGVPGAMDRLLPLVYEELSAMAHRQLRREGAGHTFSTGELVHEAYLRLIDQTRVRWADRGHFYAVAARVMRRVLVDHARRHRAARRGGTRRRISLEELERTGAALTAGDRADLLIALDEALKRLFELDERLARVVELRFFAGLTTAEAAQSLGVTTRTVDRDWVKARGWLYRELRDDLA